MWCFATASSGIVYATATDPADNVARSQAKAHVSPVDRNSAIQNPVNHNSVNQNPANKDSNSPSPAQSVKTPQVEDAVIGGGADGQAGIAAGIAEFHGSVERYREAIIEIENLYGVYDSALTHQLMGLGLAQQAQGNNEEAIGAFQRAQHLSRINNGLHNLEQVPILKHLIASYEKVNDWENAGDKHFYLYRLQRRQYGYSDPRLLEPIVGMVDWHLNAFAKGTSADPGNHLLQARALNDQAIVIIEQHYGGQDDRLAEALYRQARTNYQLAVYQANNANSLPGEIAARQSEVNFIESDVRKAVLSLNPYSDGKRALVRRVQVVESNPETPIRNRISALVHLGDWYFMFDKRDSAMRTYRQALRLGEEDESLNSEIQRYFGKPHVLSFYAANEDPVKESETTGYVEATFNITPGGRAQRVKIIDSSPPDLMDVRVQKSIRATRYRPRFVEGQPVMTEGVTYRHVFEVKPES